MTLAANLVIKDQSLGSRIYSEGFEGVNGILGVGPVELTRGTLSSDKSATVPTVMNNLLLQGLIEKEVLGVYFAPPNKQ